MTIGKKIIGGYVVVLTLLALAMATALFSLSTIQTTYNRFIDVNERLIEGADSLRFEMSNQVANYRGILIYPDLENRFLEQLQANRSHFGELVGEMRQLVQNEKLHGMLEEIAALQAKSERAQARVIELARQEKRSEALALSIEEVLPLNSTLLDKVASFRLGELKLLADGRTDLAATVNLLMLMMGGVSLLALVVGLAIAVYLSRSITRELRMSINQLSSSASEILATTTEVAAGAAETSAAVTETTATVEEVKQTAQLASQKAKYVSDTAQKASNVSLAGRKSVEDAVQGMHRIQEQMEFIAESIVRLSEQSQAIGEIIATVNGLSEQSNLLAVNAAIEAARSGEQGKGFGVVAQEIKSLAEQSRQATGQVRIILGDIQKATGAAVLAIEQGNKAVKAGVKQTGDTGESIRLLAESINEAAQAATQIAASSQQQMVGMDQVVMAMDSIKQASLQNVAGTRQAEIAARSLHELGQRLSSLTQDNAS